MTDEGGFTLIRRVDTTHTASYRQVDGTWSSAEEIIAGTFSVRWPDGLPCTLVETYLIHRFRAGATSREVDGGSLRATVSKISHLVRYCWDIQTDFWNLDDEEYFQFICLLQSERRVKTPYVPKRDGNSVRAISAACIDLLRWLQDELRFRKDLVGCGPSYRIKLIKSTRSSKHHPHQEDSSVYHRLPPRDIREPKRPIPSSYRNSLWEAASSMSRTARIRAHWVTDSRDEELVTEFLVNRRELLLYLLEATGARPGELARLSVLANADCYKTRKLKLVTLKRRRLVYRVIDIQPDVAMRLELFVHGYRAGLLDRIRQETGLQRGADHVFIGILGEPMHERTMTSDFTRIAEQAGLGRVKSCMSMFRHRFITKQVAIHLKEYLSENSLVRALMTEVDYLSILKKISAITGHKSPQSLLHYIDLAWDELGAFDRIETAKKIEAAIDSTVVRLISLIGDIKTQGRRKCSDIEHAVHTLKALQTDVLDALAKATR
ncbi:MAG: hypothetical protein EON58_01800 [Alphaproteobacteria bacterium]|nr:MAG: hypothetical protein EON58_01800 [Alphaproteobacteria bacterium]